MARPKTGNKIQVNLSIDIDVLIRAKKFAEENKKSLSQITEELYVDLTKSNDFVKKNPQEAIAEIKRLTTLLEQRILKKEEDSKT